MTDPPAGPAGQASDVPAEHGHRIRDSSAYLVVLICVLIVVVVVWRLTSQQASNVFSNISLSPGA